ncbi:fungal specific transcription factor domain-containing protein [Aspergillus puulaauensis]|uniref:Xylanolytic transcriptional activator regulatory domain-containing protein n=1 Tax=Aspergillus puulaauensis TaxID=1220207 RepID=A0A7R7XWV5_9EURO|nr:uncharacterized protein APUU_70507A [Aspergillus puulaauensis]BCS28937.1 hypothetical protein APUU_70507A [Aspergillus puulaauensis]
MRDAIEYSRAQDALAKAPCIDFLETNTGPNVDASSPGEQSTASSPISSVQTPKAQQGLYSAHGLTVISPGVEELSSFESIPWLLQGSDEKEKEIEGLMLGQDSHSNNFPITTGLGDSSFAFTPSTVGDFTENESSTLPELTSGATSTSQDVILSLRYPVLQPLMPFIKTELSPDLACGLLDLYFASAFPTRIHPLCKHIHCFLLRKASFLSERNPRLTSPALLASMLWVAASDDHALSLPITAHYRKKLCQILSSLTVKLLKPYTTINNASLSTGELNFGTMPYPPTPGDGTQSFGRPAVSLDDVITHMHIASITSASEQGVPSLRWWYAAFTLAREQKLNREIETTSNSDGHDLCFSYMSTSFDSSVSTRKPLGCLCFRNCGSVIQITEEQREERRRVWWLLYIMDRHLALCHSRPLMLLDSESKDLLLPLDEEVWQAGEIHSNSANFAGPHCTISGSKNMRRIFPDFTCRDTSVFGFFLPLMTIMGQIIDLTHLKNHPMLGPEALRQDGWEAQLHEVLRQLDLYEASLTAFITSALDLKASSVSATTPNTTKRSEPQAYFWVVQTVTSYASYYVDVLHILQDGKWDPVSLMQDKSFWDSSPNFASAIPHALKAADSVTQILKFDPDVSFMPNFFGIQLLQGGFYFLLILERLQDKAGEPFLSACEVMIRATESYIVTLDTGFQRHFCQIMRSSLAQARGRPASHYEIQQRRRAILALYQWTGAGTGLAV